MMGNKGGVGIRMNINDSSICFICVHMAAHREKVSERNSEFHRILNELSFPLVTAPDKEPESVPIAAHDIIYWVGSLGQFHLQLGDLNYRITSDVPDSVVFDYARNNFKHLLSRDQLLVSQNAGFAFVGFTEPPITFPPTYKYIRGSSLYDDRKEKKIRAPSWCDRILYCLHDVSSSTEVPLITVVDYNHVPSMVTSDHKPVFQRAVVLVKKYDEECIKRVREATEAVLQAGNRDGVPQVIVSSTEIDFGEIQYKVGAHQIVQIRNDSECNAYYRFLPKDKENHVISSLFTLSTLFGVILPHQTQTLSIELFIDSSNIQVVGTQGAKA